MKRTRMIATIFAIVTGVLWSQDHLSLGAESGQQSGPTNAARFVGSGKCLSCHAGEGAEWRQSQHHAAMAEASEQTVLGNFNDATFSYAGITSKFFKRDGKFYARTDGPDGKLADYQIKYTFGVYPLQQYLVEFPDGRLQPLPIAWDARAKTEHGQRWFHLYPKERITYKDELHWTRAAQNWNYMCADCHSTELRKNYDRDADLFRTHWAEINVGCEACHGPGSRHLAWAEAKKKDEPAAKDDGKGLSARLDERRGVTWDVNPATGNAIRSRSRTTEREIEVCAQCHARRGQIADGYEAGKPFLDYYRPALLTSPLYYANGQQRDEVYNWGSFLQSKMFASGVTCSDCHNPHSGKLRAEGNALCAKCHLPAKYDTTKHHHHKPGSAGAACTACHMPARTYMVVDPRRDHSFRIPRPDLSVKLGTPNACNDCHKDKKATWAARAVEKWYGPKRKGFQAFAPALTAARAEQLDAPRLLRRLATDKDQPAIARATADAELAPYLTPAIAAELQRGLIDPDPLVRLGALRGLASLPLEQRWSFAGDLLNDPVRTVRIEAASFLAAVPADQLNDEQRTALDHAIAEYIAAQEVNADRPDAHLNLGLLYAQRGDAQSAEAEYRTAIKLERHFIAAYVNLADLYRAQGRDAEGERTLRAALSLEPDEASVQHALGLLLVREKKLDEALVWFESAAQGAPENPRYAYVYGIALNSTGQTDKALDVLAAAQRRHPADRDLLYALISMNRDAGRSATAQHYVEQLNELAADDSQPPGISQNKGRGQ